MSVSIRDEFKQGSPPPGYKDTEVLLLTREGVWLADGEEISHDPTRRLFAKSIRRDEKGYFIHVGHEFKRIEVEDTAFFVQRLEGSPEAGYRAILSDETEEPVDPRSLTYRPGRLTCRVKAGEEEARFLRSPYFEILRHLEEDDATYFVRLGGVQALLSRK
jgi:hypothetical protein